MVQTVQIPLPKNWPVQKKSSILHTISLASTVFTSACGWTAKRADKIAHLQAELENAKSEIALLKEEMSVKYTRLGCVPSHRRPYYRPFERMRILKVKAARG